MSDNPKDGVPVPDDAAVAHDGGAYRLDTLARLSPMGIFRTDSNGGCTYVSERWCEMAGVAPADALGSGWTQVIHPDDREQVAAAWYAAVAAQHSFRLECRFLTPEGVTRWILGRAAIEKDAAGKPIGYIGTIIDITQQRETEQALEAREAAFQSLIQNIPGTVFRCKLDEHWSILFLSDHIEALSGYPLTDFINNQVRSYASIIHPDDIARVDREVRTSVERHAPYTIEYRIIHADGTTRWVLENGRATYDKQGAVAWLEGVITDITAHKHTEHQLRQHSQRLQALLDLSQEFATLDLDKVLQTTTERVAELSEFKDSAVYLLEGDTLNLRATTPPLAPDFPDELHDAPLAQHPHIRNAVETQRPVFLADTAQAKLTQAERRVSELRNLRSILYLPLIVRGQTLGILIVTSPGVARPISPELTDLCQVLANMAALAVENARLYRASQQYAAQLETKVGECKAVASALRDSEARYRQMFQANPHPMWVFDLQTLRFLAVNDAAVDHYGYSREEFLGMTIEGIRPPEDIPALKENLSRPVQTGIDNAGTWRHRKRDGSLIDVVITSHRMDFDGRSAELVLAYDITERKLAEARIEQLAHFDSLTGLPNRTLLNDRIAQAISLAHRSHQPLALIFIDLDHFKHINDTLGHRIGDELLIEAAHRLRAVVREEDTVSRFGGDEFILLLPGTDADGAARVVEKLLETLSRNYQIEQHELIITSSIGIAMYPDDGKDLSTLSMSADIAMYRAKRDGRNNYRFFTKQMQARSTRNLQLRSALLRALEQNQLVLHYQPQLALDSGKIIGAEALLRWQHPELGWVSPVEFIPLAEDSGAIIAIGEWVLRHAIDQLKRWMDAGLSPFVMAVNLSAIQFRHANLPRMVSQALSETGLSPRYLELELTESMAMENPASAIRVMDELYRREVRTSIDDFGTGYSSLSHLKRFHVYKLKIARPFIRDIVSDPDDKAIVRAIISMASGIGLRTLAEGGETKEQLDYLIESGCDELQGNYYSPPLPAKEFEAFVKSQAR